MKRLIAALALACLSQAAPAADEFALNEFDRNFSQVGFGLRVEFGAAERAPISSFAITTTGQFVDREVTFALLAFDFRGRRSGVGTLMGLPVSQRALRHELRVLPVLPLLSEGARP